MAARRAALQAPAAWRAPAALRATVARAERAAPPSTGAKAAPRSTEVKATPESTGAAGTVPPTRARVETRPSTAADRRDADVRAEATFDCTAVSGTVYQGHCYYPSPTPTSWDVASTTSCAAPSHLVVITTAGEQDIVAAILPGIERWIGFRKDPGPPNQEATFHWVTKETLGFKIWESYDTGPPEPNYTGDCVRMQPTNDWGDTAAPS